MMFRATCLMNDDEKRKVGEMSGKMIQWMLEGRSVGFMAEMLEIYPWMVDYNMDEMLYTLLKEVGVKRYLKVLFSKLFHG